jgi:predicted nucleic acid-binding protein
MAANALIDTGTVLALLDKTDLWRQVSVDTFKQLRLPVITSGAVLTELFHLVGNSRRESLSNIFTVDHADLIDIE